MYLTALFETPSQGCRKIQQREKERKQTHERKKIKQRSDMLQVKAQTIRNKMPKQKQRKAHGAVSWR